MFLPAPAQLSTEIFLAKSLERPLYLLLGNRSVKENRLRLILMVRSKLCWSASASNSMFPSVGKNFFERACTIGRLRICSHEGRQLGEIYSINLMTVAISWLKWSGILGNFPFMTFLQRPCMSSALKGGTRAHISQRTQPSDQMSLLLSQGWSRHTSGLAQQGVPVYV